MTVVGIVPKGIDRALARLQREIGKRKKIQSDNVFKAAHFLFREAQEVVPIDTGNLAGSGSVRKVVTDPLAAEVVYNAQYAFMVHERPEEIAFQRPAARHKWLEVTAIENRHVIARIAREGR